MAKKTCKPWTKEDVDLLMEWVKDNPDVNSFGNRELRGLFPGRTKGAIYAKWNEQMHKTGRWTAPKKTYHRNNGSISLTVMVDKAYADFNILKGMVKQLEDENVILKEKLKSIKSMF